MWCPDDSTSATSVSVEDRNDSSTIGALWVQTQGDKVTTPDPTEPTVAPPEIRSRYAEAVRNLGGGVEHGPSVTTGFTQLQLSQVVRQLAQGVLQSELEEDGRPTGPTGSRVAFRGDPEVREIPSQRARTCTLKIEHDRLNASAYFDRSRFPVSRQLGTC